MLLAVRHPARSLILPPVTSNPCSSQDPLLNLRNKALRQRLLLRVPWLPLNSKPHNMRQPVGSRQRLSLFLLRVPWVRLNNKPLNTRQPEGHHRRPRQAKSIKDHF
jgi:hypothetical protein